MRKTKKSLAVFLSALMLMSFIPIFASAATVMSKANCTLIEAPKLSYNGGEATSSLVVPNGASKADVTIVGGKVAYEGTEVAGFFSWSSTATGSPSTSALAVGDVTVTLYFHPTDTTNYSRGSWRPSASSPIEGWPTLAVDGLDCTIAEAPTVSGDLPSGKRLSTLALSGGKVIDADGNDITSNGTWTFVSSTSIPTESGNQEVKWVSAGYDVPKTTVYVTVKFITAILAEAPTVSYNLNPGDKLSSASIKSGTGKVVDEDGNDITANGTWTVDKTNLTDTDLIWRDTTVPVKWSATGYSAVTADMPVGCKQPDAYYIDALPKFAESRQTLTYSPDRTWGSLTLIPGKVTDKTTGEEIPGTYSLWTSNKYTTRAEDNVIGVSTKYSYGLELKTVYIRFDPADTNLPSYECGFDGVYGTKADFALTADSELVLNYSAEIERTYYGDALKYSTLKTEPENAGVYSITWNVEQFDPATADYGSVTMVEVTVTPTLTSCYNKTVMTIPVRIQNYIHSSSNPWYISSHYLSLTGNAEQAYDGIKEYKIDFTNKRLTGTVDLVINDEAVVSVSPDENGKFYAEGTWQAPASGDYTYYFRYNPAEADTATVTNPETIKLSFTLDIRPMHTLTVIIGDEVYTENVRLGFVAGTRWDDMCDNTESTDFGSWVFTDEDGNVFTPEVGYGNDYDVTSQADLYIVMPDHDVTATAKFASDLGVLGGLGDFSSIKDFFKKIIDWFKSFFEMLFGYFIPTMESL